MDIYKQRQILFLKGTLAEKLSGLVLTESNRTLWVMFGQGHISLNSLHRKIKVMEMADRWPWYILQASGSA